jgi:hypothetical protein
MVPKFPLNTWGKVTDGPHGVTEVCVEQVGQGGGFLILVRDPRGTWDNWFETDEHVLAYLEDFRIEW